jgi:hypothetical protein
MVSLLQDSWKSLQPTAGRRCASDRIRARISTSERESHRDNIAIPHLCFFEALMLPNANTCRKHVGNRINLCIHCRALYELRDFQGAVDAFQGALAINASDTVAR